MTGHKAPGPKGDAPHIGIDISSHGNGTPYHDPACVREWVETSAVNTNSFTGQGSDQFHDNDLSYDFTAPVTIDNAVNSADFCDPHMQAVSMDSPQGLDFVTHCTSNSGQTDYSYDMMSTITGLEGHNMELSFVPNEGQFENPVVLPPDNYVHIVPGLDDMSFCDPSGTHSMCHQTSTQGFQDRSTEWISPDSTPEFVGVPVAQMMPGPSTLKLNTLDNTAWSGNDSISHGNCGSLHPVNSSEINQLSHMNCHIDNRFGEVICHEFGSSDYSSSITRLRHSNQVHGLDPWQLEGITQGSNAAHYALAMSSRRSSEGEPTVTARKHRLYKAEPKEDGLYHCPFEENCKHKAEKLKCNYE